MKQALRDSYDCLVFLRTAVAEEQFKSTQK